MVVLCFLWTSYDCHSEVCAQRYLWWKAKQQSTLSKRESTVSINPKKIKYARPLHTHVREVIGGHTINGQVTPFFVYCVHGSWYFSWALPKGMSEGDEQSLMEQEINLGINISSWTARCMHQQMTTSSFICGRRKGSREAQATWILSTAKGQSVSFFLSSWSFLSQAKTICRTWDWFNKKGSL